MLKAKLLCIAGILAIAAMIFVGCPDDGGGEDFEDDPSTVKVKGVTLTASDKSTGSCTIYLGGVDFETPDRVSFTAAVEPKNAANTKVTWTVTPNTYVTWDESTHTVTAKAKGGPTTVTVTTADGGFTKSHTITVADPADYVRLTGISITNSPLAFTKNGNTFTPASAQLQLAYAPADASNRAVTYSSAPEGVVDVSNEGVVTPISAGDATITVTSALYEDVTAAINVSVAEVEAVYELKLYNQGTPAAGTTTTLPEMDAATRRYTINNANSAARMWAGAANSSTVTGGDGGIVDTTMVYLDKPVTGTTLSISARVRIKTMNRTPSGENGVIMGLLSGYNTTNVRFMGIRVTTNQYVRLYNSRNANTNSSSALSGSGYAESPPSSGTSTVAPSLIDGAAIPFDEEFILEYERTNDTNYTGRLRDYAGNIIASANNTGAYNITSGYLGFIIANAEVEISQITIVEGETMLFTSSQSTPTPTPVAGIEFTAPDVEAGAGSGEYTYTYSRQAGDDLDISARALPARAADKVITWTANGSAALSADTGNNTTVTFSAVEEVVITAAAGGKTATLTIDVTNDSIPVSAITISPASGSIMAGNGTLVPETLQFNVAVITPPNASDKTVTWKVYGDSGGTSPATAANFSSPTPGLLTASSADIASDTTVYVFAEANDGSGKRSAGTPITIKKFKMEIAVSPASGSVMAGDTTATAAPKTLQFTASITPDAAKNEPVSWSVWSNEAGTVPTSSASINPSSGLLTAGNDLSADDPNVWVFAAVTSDPAVTAKVKIMVTKYTAHVNKFWNFSTPAFSGVGSGGSTIDDLTVLSGWTALAASGATLGGITFTHRLSTGTASTLSGGIPTNKAVRFDVTAPATITVYSNNNNSGRNWILVSSNGTRLGSVNSGTMGSGGVGTINYDGTGGTVYLYADNSLYLYGVKVDYK